MRHPVHNMRRRSSPLHVARATSPTAKTATARASTVNRATSSPTSLTLLFLVVVGLASAQRSSVNVPVPRVDRNLLNWALQQGLET